MKMRASSILPSAFLLVAVFLCVLPFSSAQSAASTQNQVQAHARRAAQYLHQNKPDLAIPEFRSIVALEPNNLDARGNLGVLLFFQGKYAESIPEFRSVLKSNPDLSKIRALLGIAEKRTGDLAAARGDLQEAFPKVKDQKIRIETGLELVEVDSALGDLDKAAATVNVLRQIDPANEAILYTAYRVYSDLSAQSLLSLSVVAPNSARMRQAMAHQLAMQGNNAAAIENYRQALKLDPNLPGLHFELAEMLNLSTAPADRAEAEHEYEQALTVNPLDEQSECRLGDIAMSKNALPEAQRRYKRAVELRPNDPDATLGLGRLFMAMGQREKAQSLFEKAIHLDPTSAAAHFRLGTIYRETGRIEDAKRELAEYEKYKAMKEKLQNLYHTMRVAPGIKDQGGMGEPQ